MNFEKLMDALTEGDDEIEIHIKHKVNDEDECSGCDKDFCPLDDYDEDDEDSDDEADSVDISEMADSLKGEIEDVYKETLKAEGKEAADKLIDLSIQQTLIDMALHERIPLRVEDVEKYNDLVEGEHGDWYVDLMYMIHSGILKEAGEKIKKK